MESTARTELEAEALVGSPHAADSEGASSRHAAAREAEAGADRRSTTPRRGSATRDSAIRGVEGPAAGVGVAAEEGAGETEPE